MKLNVEQLQLWNNYKSRLQRDSNLWPPRYLCDALPTELWSHTLGARSIYWIHSPVRSEMMWSIYEIIHTFDLAPNVWLHSSVGRASHRYRGGHGFESCWSLDFFRLLLSNCLNWKIYCDDHSSLWSTTAVQMYELFHIYFTSFHSSRENELNKIDLAPNVWLHSSVGRASHRYRGGHGFESCWSLDFFRLLLSNCLNWKIYCDDHSSLWSTTAVQMYELFHKRINKNWNCFTYPWSARCRNVQSKIQI